MFFYDTVINNKDFLDVMLQFFTALGTVSTVIVSLFLALKKDRPRIRASLSIVGIHQNMYGRYCVQRPLLKNNEISNLYLMIYIRNIGTRTITIQNTSFYMDIKIPDKKILFNALDAGWDYKKYPKTLLESTSSEFIIQKYDDFLNHIISEEHYYKKLKYIKMFVLSEAGITYRVKIHKNVLRDILQDAEKQKSKQ